MQIILLLDNKLEEVNEYSYKNTVYILFIKVEKLIQYVAGYVFDIYAQ